MLLFSFTRKRVCQDRIRTGPFQTKSKKLIRTVSVSVCSVAYGPEGDRCRVVDLDDPDLHDLLRLAGEDDNEGLGGRPILSAGQRVDHDEDDVIILDDSSDDDAPT